MNDNTHTAVLCHTLVEVLDKVVKVGVSDVLKLEELELEREVLSEKLLLELDELEELELDGVVEEDSVDEDTTGGVTGGVTVDETESVPGSKENSEEADEPGGVMLGGNEDVGSPTPVYDNFGFVAPRITEFETHRRAFHNEVQFIEETSACLEGRRRTLHRFELLVLGTRVRASSADNKALGEVDKGGVVSEVSRTSPPSTESPK